MTMATSLSLLPQILTRSIASSLIEDLDASDILECYSLTRNAVLSGFRNATIQKMALGIRYYPHDTSRKRPLELTLEYGPQRVGEWLEEESMPLLVMEEDHLSWDNEGKVYYTTDSIQSHQWKSAYYMAPLSGAVLSKLLEKAVGYAQQKPRYQPFSVIVEYSQKPLLRSSSSVDFVYQMFTDMAELGVDLRPILPPPKYQARLHASGHVEKVSGYDSNGKFVPAEAAQFYSKFSSCFVAIASGDYSQYRTPTPSLAPSISVTSQSPTMTSQSSANNTDSPTISPSPMMTADETGSPTHAPSVRRTPSPTKDESNSKALHDDVDIGKEGDYTDGSDKKKSTNKQKKHHKHHDGSNETVKTENSNDDGTDDSVKNPNGYRRSNRYLYDLVQTFSSRLLVAPRDQDEDEVEGDDVFLSELSRLSNATNGTVGPSLAPTIDTATEAEKAAQEAKEAAEEARNASSHEKADAAVDAAAHAADAAQHAAAAARWEKDMTGILSGDGDLMTQALQHCWIDPKYGLVTENSSNVVAYIYLDGNFFYRMNLTAPFIDVVRVEVSIPQTPSHSSVTVDDFVDWTLAFFILGLGIIGLFAIVQQLGIRLVFYKTQKWFFRPSGHQANDANDEDDYDGDDDDNSSVTTDDGDDRRRGRGHMHFMSEDVIPLSMGGRRQVAPTNLLVTNSPTSVKRRSRALSRSDDNNNNNDGNGHVELTVVSMSNGDDSAPTAQVPPLRFTRHPDMVDLPSLLSTSKVATPVTTNSLSDHHGGRTMKDFSYKSH